MNLRCVVLIPNVVLYHWPSFGIFGIRSWFLHYRLSSAVPAPTSRMIECEVIGFDGEDRSLKSALIHPAPPLLLVLPQAPIGVDCWLTTEWLFGMLRRSSIVLWYPSCHVVNLSYRNHWTVVCQSHCWILPFFDNWVNSLETVRLEESPRLSLRCMYVY